MQVHPTHKHNLFFALSLSIFMLLFSNSSEAQNKRSIVPLPASIVHGTSQFKLDSKTTISCRPNTRKEAKALQNMLKPATGYNFNTCPFSKSNSINLRIDKSLNLKKEGYLLKVTQDNITITGADAAGVFWGIQSLRQLLPAKI